MSKTYFPEERRLALILEGTKVAQAASLSIFNFQKKKFSNVDSNSIEPNEKIMPVVS